MKNLLKYIKSCIAISALFFIMSTTVSGQDCSAILLSKQTVQFSLGGGSDTNIMAFPGGCSNPSITYLGVPSWLTVTNLGNTINVSCGPTSSYRQANIAVLSGGTIGSIFMVEQGTAPPPPSCTISSTSSLMDIDAYGGTVSSTLTFTNCTPAYLIFSQLSGGSIPSWLSITQSNSTSVTFQATINSTNDIRSAQIRGSRPGGGSAVFLVSQLPCSASLRYPDSDGDGFGDAFSTPVTCLDLDPNVTYADNNGDRCPGVFGSDHGCAQGQAPENRNWITAKTYDINGNVTSNTKSYFDELGKGIQTQSIDLKTGKTWATQALYDAKGRPALQSLSAPIRSDGTFLYTSSFIKKTNGNPYTNSDFESDPENPEKVGDNPNTLGWYYSTQNTDSHEVGNDYQDITKRPYSRAIYSELNPGTVLKTIGGNKTVDTNNDGDVNDDEDTWHQGYTFSMPAGDELSFAGAFNDAAYKTSNGNRKIIKTISRDVHEREAVVFTDTDGKTLAAARVGGSATRTTEVKIGAQGYVDVHVPQGTTGFTVNGVPGITTEVYNLITEQTTASATNSLTSGFYRVSITNLDSYNPTTPSNTVSVTYHDNYYDYSLNEYDETGRLIASYQPVGATKDQKPVSTFEYNALGQLTKTTSPDEGTAEFKYRKDGQIRFSQNSKQLAASPEEFSYTNYDDLGRPVESGVATGDFLSLDADTSLVNSSKPEEKQETLYDYLEAADKTFLLSVHASYRTPTFLSGNVAKTKNQNTTTYYSYDIYGRVKWIVQDIDGLTRAKTIDYKYDPITGAVLEVDFQKNVAAERFKHKYTYDTVDNSLIKVQTSTDNGATYTTHADYKYYETGALRQIELAPVNGTPLQAIDYVYNLNGQLKAINPGNDTNDLFSMQIDYHTNDYARTVSNISSPNYGENQYNGNIKGVRWKNKEIVNSDQTYSYYYNKNNWLTDAIYGQYTDVGGNGTKINIFEDSQYISTTKNLQATNSITLMPGFHAKPDANTSVTVKIVTGTPSTFQSGEYNVFDITYDANGNIRTLNRNKNTANGSNKMDQLNYTYDPAKPNRLKRVDDAVGQVLAGKDIGDQDGNNYEYNKIGQLIKNNKENIEYIYNASGLVTEVKKDGQTRVKFFYNDKGHRVKKEAFIAGSANLDYTEHYVRDAAGTALAIYRDGTAKEHTIYGTSRLGVFNRTGATTGSSVYQLTDHLGNVRAVVQRSGSDAVALVATDYYPGGMAMPGRNVVGDYRYNYQGQELDQETGKVAFELRLYDPRINRWLTTDPAGQYHSPYMYMGNNWVSQVDPDGAKADDWYVNNETGELEWHNTSANIDGLTWVGTNSADYDYLSSMSSMMGGSGMIPVSQILERSYYDITGGFNSGLEQRGKDFMAFVDNPIERTANGLINMADSGKAFMMDFVNSGESDLGLFAANRAYDGLSNMTLYDWSYAAGYNAPDIALSFAGGYALSGIRGLQIGFNTNWRLMRSYNYAGGNIKFQIGVRNINTNYHFRFERHRINGKFNTHFNYGTGGRHHWPPLKN